MLTARNETEAQELFKKLSNQYTVTGSNDTVLNMRRRKFFEDRCNDLNDVYNVPESYCPFFWDDVACWNATPPYSTVQSPCVSWAMSHLPPPNTFVERKCLNGTWENLPSRTLEMLYNNCSDDSYVSEPTFEESMQTVVRNFRLVALVGYCGSAVALVIAMFLFWYLRKLQSGRNWIHFNLFLVFLLRCGMCVIEAIRALLWRNPISECSDFEWNSTFYEKLFTALWNYSIIASYVFVLVEGLYLFSSIYFNVFKESPLPPYLAIGWGTPALIIFGWGFIKANWDNTPYWVANCNDNVTWAIRGPMIIVCAIEVVVTVGIMRQLHSKVQDEIYLDERARYRKFAKSFTYLLLSIGGSYIFFDLLLYFTSVLNHKKVTLYAHLFYIVVNSLYGMIISHIYCFNNSEIRQATKNELRKVKQRLMNIGNRQRAGHCSLHTQSPLLALSNGGETHCAECALKWRLFELNTLPKLKTDTSCSNTVCSTVVSSEQNTLNKVPQRVYPRVTYLSFCREEGDETGELGDIEGDL
uniref:G_PROTEIN_RECEP_F2_4 domain-containing protein n=1 Tax=Panagrellus redivivus TaxID=6233 RepID=A0A7E4WE76_PANRE